MMDYYAMIIGYAVVVLTSVLISFFILMALFFWVANKTVFKSRHNRVTAGRIFRLTDFMANAVLRSKESETLYSDKVQGWDGEGTEAVEGDADHVKEADASPGSAQRRNVADNLDQRPD